MPVEYLIYIPIVGWISSVLLLKAKNKPFMGLFLFWLFGSPIFLNPKHAISLGLLGIDIQPNRFLFLILTPLLYVVVLTPSRFLTSAASIKPTGLKSYEKLLIGYILIVIFALVLNIGPLGARKVIVEATNIIAFIVVYFCAKKFIHHDDFVLFQVAILALATISAVVALYQFFVNPEFFRLGAVRAAFLDYYRSNGLFTAEYDQGLFLNLSIIVAMSTNLKWWIKVSFIAIACLGIFVTMHRLSWVALMLVLGLIWFFYLRRSLLTNTLVPLLLIYSAFVALNIPWSNITMGKFSSSLITDRIFADTITVRMNQYKFAFDMFKEYPLGIGGYSTPLYTKIAYNHGVAYSYAANSYNKIIQAYIIHNGLLSAGVKYGVLGLILFALFLFTSIFDFLKCSVQSGKNWYPLLMIMIVFLVFNLTNDFSFLGSQIGVALAWLMGGYVAVINPNDVGDTNVQPTV